MNINVIKKHLQTNKHTFNIFRQISPFERETKHCDVCSKDVLKESYKKTSQKHRNSIERNLKKIGLEGDIVETKPFEITTLQ